MMLHTIKLEATHLANPPCQIFISAGIICFSVHPTTSDIFLLLGEEETQETFCDFGGSINPSESVEGAAAREFAEESLCVIYVHGVEEIYDKYENSVKQHLLNGNYLLKLEILQNTVDGVDYVRVYFLKQVPWQPQVKDIFQQVKRAIVEGTIIHPAVQFNQDTFTVEKQWLEKNKIKYWSLERLKYAIKNNGKYKHKRFRKTFVPVLVIVIQQLLLFS